MKQINAVIILNMTVFTLFANIGICQPTALSVDLNNDGIEDAVNLIKTPARVGGSASDAALKIESKGKVFSSDSIFLEFSNDSYLRVINGFSKKRYIGLFAPGGMHGLWLSIYSFGGDVIKEESNIFSDLPSIEISDLDKDGVDEIVATCRDLDNDVLRDSYIKTYKNINERWKLISVYRTKTGSEVPLKEWADDA
jgi:hypothetical protein